MARESLLALGKTPSFVPGMANRAAAFVIERLFPKSAAVRTMGKATRKMYGLGSGARPPHGELDFTLAQPYDSNFA